MAHVNIVLNIFKSINGYPPAPNTTDDDDKIPWRMAQMKRGDLPAGSKKGIGHRPKFEGYFYRFTEGNTKFGNAAATNTNDGDFEFELNRGVKTVQIKFHVANGTDWEFHSVSLTTPLLQTNDLPAPTIDLNNNTNDDSVTSGQIGMVVRTTALGNKTYLFVDPDWDNR